MDNLLNRLENVAARLERFEVRVLPALSGSSMSRDRRLTVATRFPQGDSAKPGAPVPVAAPPAPAAAAPASPASNGAHAGPSVSDFDAIIDGQLARFVSAGQAIGGQVRTRFPRVCSRLESASLADRDLLSCSDPPRCWERMISGTSFRLCAESPPRSKPSRTLSSKASSQNAKWCLPWRTARCVLLPVSKSAVVLAADGPRLRLGDPLSLDQLRHFSPLCAPNG